MTESNDHGFVNISFILPLRFHFYSCDINIRLQNLIYFYPCPKQSHLLEEFIHPLLLSSEQAPKTNIIVYQTKTDK